MVLLILLPSLLHHVTAAGEVSVRKARSSDSAVVDDRKVVCYYANWAVYRKGDAKFTPQNINPYLCTHLIYAFGGLGRDDSIVPFDEYQDIEKGGYGRFAALKTYNKDLKTLLAIGGWNEGSRRFSPLVADPDRRQVFIKSAIRFLRQYNFDGVDLDWEYPTQRQGGRPQDKHNYAILIKEMREAFESESKQTRKPRLLISMAVPASLKYAGEGYDIASLSQDLDWFNLLTYDYHSAQEPAANHHAPLYKPDTWSEFDFRVDLNIDATIKFYLKHGASRDKLVLGIPTYGRSYTLANPDAHETGSPTVGPGAKGAGTQEDGYLAYYEICERVLDQGWELETQFPGVMGPYAHKEDQWVGFDDVDMAVEKAFYVAEEGLGGIMFWTIDNDDFRGKCGKTPYPLIESAKDAMFSVKSSVQTKTSVSVSTSEQTSVTRLRLTHQELASLATSSDEDSENANRKKLSRPSTGRKDSPRSLSLTTPAPPTTPSSGPAFKCRGEGFFPHPVSCKKYYWCLDDPNQGSVAHTFSCPQGLYFNPITDGCDFLRNVNCGDKEIKETVTKKSTQSTSKTTAKLEETDDEDNDVEDPKSLQDILDIVKAAGGVEGLQKQIEEEERSEKEEEDRRVSISSRTRNRLSQLLNGGKDKSERKEVEKSDTRKKAKPVVPRRQSIKSRPPNTRTSFLSRLANRRRPTQSSEPEEEKNNKSENIIAEEASSTPPTTSTPRRKSSLFRDRFRLSSNKDTTQAPTTSKPKAVSNLRSRFRNLLSRKPASSTTISSSTTTSIPPLLDTATDSVLTISEENESGGLVKIVGAHLEQEEPEEQALHLGVFKPKAGVREKLRDSLHTVLEHEMIERQQEKDHEDLEQSTPPPDSTVNISKNTRLQESKERGDAVRASAGRKRLRERTKSRQRGGNRFVSKLRGRPRVPGERVKDFEKQVGAEHAYLYNYIHDTTENKHKLESLAKFYSRSDAPNRVKREDVSVVYPNSPSSLFYTPSADPFPYELSNSIAYVYPATSYIGRGGRQDRKEEELEKNLNEKIMSVTPEPRRKVPSADSNLNVISNDFSEYTKPKEDSIGFQTEPNYWENYVDDITTIHPQIHENRSFQTTTELLPEPTYQTTDSPYRDTTSTSQTEKMKEATTSPQLSTNASPAPPNARENEIVPFDDYEDWGVVVSVVKSVSESDKAVSLIYQEQELTTTESAASTTVVTTVEDVSTTHLTSLEPTSEMITEETTRVPTTERTIKVHPFLNSLTTETPFTEPEIKVHPFLQQMHNYTRKSSVKSTNPTTVSANPTTVSTIQTTISTIHTTISTTQTTISTIQTTISTISSIEELTTVSSLSTNTTPLTSTSLETVSTNSGLPSLFGKFHLHKQSSKLNKSTTTKSAQNLKKPKKFIPSFKSRLSHHERPSFLQKKKEITNEADELITNEVEDHKKESPERRSKYSNKLKQTNKQTKLQRPSLNSLNKRKRPDKSKKSFLISQRPRPKRLQSGFSGLKPFKSRFVPKKPNTFEISDEKVTTLPQQTTEKQTVGEIIAQLKGESKTETKPVTLRPKSFKPKSGINNKIRELLQAELAELADDKKEESIETEKPETYNEQAKAKAKTQVKLNKPLSRRKSNSFLSSRRRTIPHTRGKKVFRKETEPAKVFPTKQTETTVGRQRSRFPVGRVPNRNRLRSQLQNQDSKKKDNNIDKSSLLGQTVVRDIHADLTLDTEEVDVDDDVVAVVHDQSITDSFKPTIQSPFQVLIDDNNKQVMPEEDEHDTHVHDFVQDHHPEIHFRHLKPDLASTPAETPRISENNGFLLPTRLPITETGDEIDNDSISELVTEFEITTLSSLKSHLRQSAFLPTVAPLEVTAQQTTEEPTTAAITITTRKPLKRRRKIKRKQRRKPAVGEKTNKVHQPSQRKAPSKRVSTATGGRRRVSHRHRNPPVFKANTNHEQSQRQGDKKEQARRTRPRFRSKGVATVSVDSTTMVPSDSFSTTPIKSEDEGKLTTFVMEEPTSLLTTSVVENISTTPKSESDTTIIISNDHQYFELTTEAEPEEEVSTLHPGKFKPKFGSNKLREKLRKELESKREKESQKTIPSIEDVENKKSVDSHLSDIEQPDEKFESTTAKTSYRSTFKRFDFKKSLPRKGRKRSTLSKKLKRRKLTKKLRKRPDVVAYKSKETRLGSSLLRKRRNDPEESGQTMMNNVSKEEPKPYLLRGGKGYESMILRQSKSSEGSEIKKLQPETEKTKTFAITKTKRKSKFFKNKPHFHISKLPSSLPPSNPIQILPPSSRSRKLASSHRTLSLGRRRRRKN